MSTGFEVGMIEVVPNSSTVAKVQFQPTFSVYSFSVFSSDSANVRGLFWSIQRRLLMQLAEEAQSKVTHYSSDVFQLGVTIIDLLERVIFRLLSSDLLFLVLATALQRLCWY